MLLIQTQQHGTEQIKLVQFVIKYQRILKSAVMEVTFIIGRQNISMFFGHIPMVIHYTAAHTVATPHFFRTFMISLMIKSVKFS